MPSCSRSPSACRHPAIALTIAAANFPGQRFEGTILLYLVVERADRRRLDPAWHRRQTATAMAPAVEVPAASKNSTRWRGLLKDVRAARSALEFLSNVALSSFHSRSHLLQPPTRRPVDLLFRPIASLLITRTYTTDARSGPRSSGHVHSVRARPLQPSACRVSEAGRCPCRGTCFPSQTAPQGLFEEDEQVFREGDVRVHLSSSSNHAAASSRRDGTARL